MRYFIYCRKSSEAEDRQVLSLESQLSTLQRTFGDRPDIEVAAVYEEAFSAKAPGRGQFNEMVARIERGDAQGIIAWAPDRLARNSIDGGRVVYLLDLGIIRDLKFATYTFENNSQGKFMLQIMFGQSKYYSDALSENVKRGNRTKLERGWRPNQAPLGYLNDPVTKTILKDPVHFPLIRRMFEVMLTGAYTPRQIAFMARDDWGFRTPKRKRIGGVPLAMSSIYKILSNPFYAGIIHWGGQVYSGKHDPVVSLDEFQRTRLLLSRTGRPRAQKHTFAFTGMFRCGTCGYMITAEHKINRHGYRYVYYHCSRRTLGPRCSEPSIELGSLEEQIAAFLHALRINPAVETWALQELASDVVSTRKHETARKLSLERTMREVEEQTNELTDLRIRKLITDSEFLERRSALQQERMRLGQKAAIDENPDAWFEPVGNLILFNSRAAEWFLQGDDCVKRQIVESIGSNLTIKGKIVNIEAKEPFSTASELADSLRQLGDVDDVRTRRISKKSRLRNILKRIRAALDDPECESLINNIRLLKERFDPKAPANLVSRSARDA
jgi:site-specific DNA recombinase